MPEKKDKVPEVLKAITAVTKGLGKEGIAKEGKNKQQNYSFRGIDQVYKVLSPLLVENDLVITPRVLSRIVDERKAKSGSALYNISLEVEFTFRSSIDGSEFTACTFGECSDSADKGTNKALSAAYKYLVFLTFCVPVEGEPDADAEHHEAEPSKSKPKAEPVTFTTYQGEGDEGLIFKDESGEEPDKSYKQVTTDISKCGNLIHLRNIYKKYVPLLDGKLKVELCTLLDIRSSELKGES